jgi:SAM-dependent methyltransferase
METPKPSDTWASGDLYEPYVGRWSRLVAREFLRWLDVPAGRSWLDVGCGTGALTQTILNEVSPQQVKGVDRSEGYVAYSSQQVQGENVSFEVGDAQSLSFEPGSFDAVVSGLVLNFVPEPQRMVSSMARVVRSGGVVAVYVWDYAGEMQFMRHFWDAAAALDPAAKSLDEGVRFPICNPELLQQLFESANLQEIQTRAIDIPTRFQNFDDFWSPFLGGQGPAPSYAMSLSETNRAALRDYLRQHLPTAADGSIDLIARAWAVQGIP